MLPSAYGFFDDHIPAQKMVMSPYRAPGAKQASATNTHQTTTEIEPPNQNSIATDDVIPPAQANTETSNTPTTPVAKADPNQPLLDNHDTTLSAASKLSDFPQQLRQQARSATPLESQTLTDHEVSPYQIIPEVGQSMTDSQTKPAMLPKLIPKNSNQHTPQQFAYDRLIRWVSEVGVAMLTYSGDHLSRDQKNNAQYFSPQAWQTVDQTLFQGKNSPFRNLAETHANTRAIAVDWPKALQMDVTEQGKIWWLWVPLVTEVKTAKSRQRYAYEVKFGVLPIHEANEVRFLVNEIVIKTVSPPSRAAKRGRR